MNRRHFLGSLAALSAGMALDVDKLLWVPGRTTYFDIRQIHRYSRLVLESADKHVAQMTLAHDFPIWEGQDFDIRITDIAGPSARLFSGRVIGIGDALQPTGIKLTHEPVSWKSASKIGPVAACQIRRELSLG